MNKNFILIKFATRSRPERFFLGLDNIINRASDKKNIGILVSADTNDYSMFNSNVLERLKPYVESGLVVPVFGNSVSKIDAINRDMDKVGEIKKFKNWKILINFSDDMEFTVDGYDDIIRQKLSLHFPDTDGNLHFNDGYVQEKVSTMSIIGRRYYERFGYIYHPSYVSLWCDNEYTEVARKLNKIQYYPTQIFRHNHPANNNTLHRDEQYVKTESYYELDSKTYEQRKFKNFDLI